MDLTKLQNNQELQQYEFDSYLIYLHQEYSYEYIDTDDKIADRMNFEFGTLLSGSDVKKFRENNILIEEKDMRLIYKNMGF